VPTQSIAVTAHKQAELIDLDTPAQPLAPDHIRGRTLVSLTSPGTELNYAFLSKDRFPLHPGYACVFEVEEVGEQVSLLKPGDRVMGMGGHRSQQEMPAARAQPVPAGLAPEKAVFARLMGVSMSTLNTTSVTPPAHVLVTGLGPVGNLAAQLFARCGYAVTAVDPSPARRETATVCGLKDVRATAGEDLQDKIGLHAECSGHEQAALDGCKLVRKLGEVVLIGVPWARKTERYAFELLEAVFHRYVVLRSGWEWQVPVEEEKFGHHCIGANYAAALDWLASGSIEVSPLATLYSPKDCQRVYLGLLEQTLATPAALFDWRGLDGA
jgi:threonine dehydrogenase-like Zn-dependent dehydrogenase